MIQKVEGYEVTCDRCGTKFESLEGDYIFHNYDSAIEIIEEEGWKIDDAEKSVYCPDCCEDLGFYDEDDSEYNEEEWD